MIDRTGESLYLQNTESPATARQKMLGKDDFMKLLIAQLKNQSPMKPMDNRQFISQMATFSTLEQMTNMNSELNHFLQTQTGNERLMDAQLIGKEISWNNQDENGGGIVTGIVQSVTFKNGQALFETNDGTLVRKGQIIKIASPSVNKGGV